MLRYVTLRYVTLRYVTLRYVTLRYVTLKQRIQVKWNGLTRSMYYRTYGIAEHSQYIYMASVSTEV